MGDAISSWSCSFGAFDAEGSAGSHRCSSDVPGQRRRAEYQRRLIDYVSRNRRWRNHKAPRCFVRVAKRMTGFVGCNLCSLDILVRDLTKQRATAVRFVSGTTSVSMAFHGHATDMNVHPTRGPAWPCRSLPACCNSRNFPDSDRPFAPDQAAPSMFADFLTTQRRDVGRRRSVEPQ